MTWIIVSANFADFACVLALRFEFCAVSSYSRLAGGLEEGIIGYKATMLANLFMSTRRMTVERRYGNLYDDLASG